MSAANEIREQQRRSWDEFSPGWKKWDRFTMDFLRPYGEEIVSLLDPRPGQRVLDVASGTGEPGLTIAERVAGEHGEVVVTDLSEGMLGVARENAARRGITNLQVQACDVSDLPFDDDSFDAVSCRFGFMFFPDLAQAARELARVVKPGGRIATSVWGAPERNDWVTCIMGTIQQYVDVPKPPPEAPGMFRCAAPGMLGELLRDAGFGDISETTLETKMSCRDPEEYWTVMTEVAAPVVGALGRAEPGTVEAIRAEVLSKISEKYPGSTEIDAGGVVVGGHI